MSLILEKKKGPLLECQQFLKKKKGLFKGIFIGKGLISSGSSQRFLIKVVRFSSGNISKSGIFFNLENDHTSSLLHTCGQTGGSCLGICSRAISVCNVLYWSFIRFFRYLDYAIG